MNVVRRVRESVEEWGFVEYVFGCFFVIWGWVCKTLEIDLMGSNLKMVLVMWGLNKIESG